MTPPRRGMLEHMQIRKFSENTQKSYPSLTVGRHHRRGPRFHSESSIC